MSENTKGQNLDRENTDRSNENDTSGVSNERQNITRNEGSSTGLDEKSSTMGRNTKSTGISTKDGLTGSDYDGQVTDR